MNDEQLMFFALILLGGPVAGWVLYAGLRFAALKYMEAKYAYLLAGLVSAALCGVTVLLGIGVGVSLYMYYADIKRLPAKGTPA